MIRLAVCVFYVLFVVAVVFVCFASFSSFLKRPVHCKGLMGKQRDSAAGGGGGRDDSWAGLTMQLYLT